MTETTARRLSLVAAFLAAGILFYELSLVWFSRMTEPTERTFVTAGRGHPFYVYVDVVSVDPVRLEGILNLSFATKADSGGVEYAGRPEGAFAVDVSDGFTEVRIGPSAHPGLAATPFSLSMEGDVVSYPLDRYSAQLTIDAPGAHSVPLRVTVWERLNGWSLRTVRQAMSGHDLHLELSVSRAGPVIFFAAACYGVMVVVALSALTIGALVFVGHRRVEATLVGALTAMLFALPILRTVLPGEPPLGNFADLLIFLWSEIAIAIGLVFVVISWARASHMN